MMFRLFKARLSAWPTLLLIASIFLASCQNNTGLPSATLAPTIAIGTPPAVTPQPTSAATIANTPTQPAPDTSVLKGQQIVFWHPWQGGLAKKVDEAVNEFNRDNEWGIAVQTKPWYNAGALDEGINSAVEEKGNPLPHVVAGTSDQLADWSADHDLMVNLNEYVNLTGVRMSEAEIEAYNPVFWAQDQSAEMRLGLPALRTAQVLFYNRKWAQELGFHTPPTTPQAFKEQACAAAKANNSSSEQDKHGTGGWLIDNEALTTLSWLSAFGAEAIPEAEDQPYTFKSPEGEEAITFVRGLFDQGCAWVGRNPVPYDYFARRMALFYAGNLADMSVQAKALELQKSGDSWTVLPFPSEDGSPFVYASGYSYGVLRSQDENAQLAGWLFARWMETPRVAAKLTQALPSIPVSEPIAAEFGDYHTGFPWDSILPLGKQVRAAPALASWREVRRLVEDAGWQVYHLPVDDLNKVLLQTLPQLDQAAKEIIDQSK